MEKESSLDKATVNYVKATIENLNEVTRTKENDILDEVLEATSIEQRKSAYAIEVELSQEAVRIASGEYEETFVYNIPRSSDNGREDWGALCDKMPYGCPYKKKGQKHVHTVGVNITGALEIMNTYMGLQFEPSEPKIETFTFLDKGKMMTKAYWTTVVKSYNSKTDTRINVPYQVPVMQAVGGGEKYNEYGSIICVSKALRKAILMVVPGNLQKEWIDEYKGITKAHTNKPPATTTQRGTTKPKQQDKPVEFTPDQAIEHIGKIDNDSHLTNWFTKYNEWIGRQKPEDKERIINAFNTKQEELSKQNAVDESANESETQEATQSENAEEKIIGSQLDAIVNLTKKNKITPEGLAEMLRSNFLVEHTTDLTKQQAKELIAMLQEGK